MPLNARTLFACLSKNFFTNFVRQCKEPTRFGLTKTTTGALERLFAGAEEEKAEIEGENINPSNYINNKGARDYRVSSGGSHKNAAQQQENKHQYQPIDETKVYWNNITKFIEGNLINRSTAKIPSVPIRANWSTLATTSTEPLVRLFEMTSEHAMAYATNGQKLRLGLEPSQS